MSKRRLIEVDFPLREVSEQSVREKNIRHGHISTLHIWWARRPLAASRATALAALLPDDPKRRNEFMALVRDISPWEVVNQKPGEPENPLIQKARELIRQAYGGQAPKVLDCFAGGGAIPLEALRLGCETYALDYNPVAVLLLKAVLEYPQKFGKPVTRRVKDKLGQAHDIMVNPLLEAVQFWGKWVLEEARKELERFYPKDPDGSIPVGYIWARTVLCQNPACGCEIPIMRSTWLVKKDNKKVALRLTPNRAGKRVDVEIFGQDGRSLNFDPDEGTVSRSKVRCPICGGTIDNKTVQRLFQNGQAGQRMMTLVLHHKSRQGKTYRLPTKRDLETYNAAHDALESKRHILWENWAMDPIPDEPLRRVPVSFGVINVWVYGLNIWGDLFNDRQKLSLITIAEKVRNLYHKLLADGMNDDFAKAITVYMGLALDRVVTYCSNLSLWVSEGEFLGGTFAQGQSIPMRWDYCELFPFSEATGDWNSAMDWIIRVLYHCSESSNYTSFVFNGSAHILPYEDNSFDALLTDPPYYDNVPYSYLSDFYYVWLKRTVGDLFPKMFATPLTPKVDEIVAYSRHEDDYDSGRLFFEEMIRKVFAEINRVLKPGGIVLVVFAHNTTAAWETIINALLESGLFMTASWPIQTERQTRQRAKDSAALASSIYMVCRKRLSDQIGEYPQVRREIDEEVRKKLTQFWDEGIRGADFFMSAIGPAVAAFGKYARVEKLSGESVTVAELLEYVRQVVSQFALERILKDPKLGGVDVFTRFYLLYRWTYNHARVPFDEARMLAIGVGVELTNLWGPGDLVEKQKDYIKLPSPLERAKETCFTRRTQFVTLIDALHYALWLYDRNNTRKLQEHLAATFGANETFWQVAQAIAEVLPENDKEKQLLQGLLYGRRALVAGERKDRLF